jgi:glycosyltransferase involved in cell wall biosynthesis
MALPLITVITATYNRSNVLRYAIESVLNQTLPDWELIVVSDAATDDTPEVVASFNDPRIRFIELDQNHGEQSVPNNVALKLARGQFIAFLNHDDLWFPDHLECGHKRLLETGADLVFGVGVLMKTNGAIELVGVLPPEGFGPVNFVPATGWLFRRELIERVGFWTSYRESWLIPSLNWLVRAYRQKVQFASSHRITWIGITSVARPQAYKLRLAEEQWTFSEQMRTDRHTRERLLERIQITQQQQQLQYPIGSLVQQIGRHLLCRLLILSNYRLMPLWFMLKFRRKGGVIHYLRKKRGLPVIKSNATKQPVTYHERLVT